MATSISFTIPEYKGATGLAGSADYPKLLTLKTATETAVDAEITARLATAVAVARKAQVRVPVVPAQETKRAIFSVPVNAPKREALVIPVKDNDSTVFTWFPGKAISISAIKFARGETAGSTLTVSMDLVTAATAADTVQLATAVDVAAGTNAAVQTFTPDEAGGALPIAVTAAQAILITVAAGNGTVAPLALTLFVDYSEVAAAASVVWNPPVGVTVSAYKFIRHATAGGTLTLSLDKVTKATGAVATGLASLVSVAGGTNDVEQTFTADDSAPPTAFTTAQGLKMTAVAGFGEANPALTFVVEYTETSAVSGKGQATWFPGRAVSVTGITACLTETFVGATLTANLDDVVATTGVLVPLGTSQSLAALVQDVETAYVPDEAAGALPYALLATKGLRFEVVADATTKAPAEVTFTITYVDTVI